MVCVYPYTNNCPLQYCGISRNSLYRLVVYHCNGVYVALTSQQNEVSSFLRDTLQSIKLSDRGVYVQASTLGSLEALLEFLRTEKIPVSTVFFASRSFILPLVYLVELINFPERRPWNEKLMNFNAFTQSHKSLKSLRVFFIVFIVESALSLSS